jgi:protein-S-isoprenylcysteine O-methyltransferase Ste14
VRRLELRVPPVLLALIVGAFMWLVSAAVPALSVDLESNVLAALAIAAVGAGLAIAGVVEFRRAQTTVDPTSPEKCSAIVTSGIYRHTRNPMYLGFLVMLLGLAVYLSNMAALLGLAAFAIYMTRFQIIPEERILKASFGGRYEEHLSAVSFPVELRLLRVTAHSARDSWCP